MTLRVYKLDGDSICVSSDNNRVLIYEEMLDDNISLDIFAGPARGDLELLATILPAFKVGDIVNGIDITYPRPGMVVKNLSNQLVLQYLLWELTGDKPIYNWQIPGTTYGTTGLGDDNYKILDLGEIDD